MRMFIEPVIDRGQYFFLREMLEESIPADHPARVFDYVLDQHDWGQWRSDYPGGGRPAYPPEVMTKLLVYGYSIGIRSSRALEHACHNSKDFIWLLSGRTPDHDTIADFRRSHARQFKKIFRTTVAACVSQAVRPAGTPAATQKPATLRRTVSILYPAEIGGERNPGSCVA